MHALYAKNAVGAVLEDEEYERVVNGEPTSGRRRPRGAGRRLLADHRGRGPATTAAASSSTRPPGDDEADARDAKDAADDGSKSRRATARAVRPRRIRVTPRGDRPAAEPAGQRGPRSVATPKKRPQAVDRRREGGRTRGPQVRSGPGKPGARADPAGMAALAGGMFLSGHTTPRLGIDLAGGTSITLDGRRAEGKRTRSTRRT